MKLEWFGHRRTTCQSPSEKIRRTASTQQGSAQTNFRVTQWAILIQRQSRAMETVAGGSLVKDTAHHVLREGEIFDQRRPAIQAKPTLCSQESKEHQTEEL